MPSLRNFLKFDVDGVSLCKPKAPGIGEVLRNHNSEILTIFFGPTRISTLNEAELLTAREVLQIYLKSLQKARCGLWKDDFLTC